MKLILEPSKKDTRLPDILRAALTLFVEKGIEATTTKDIAARAKVSEGALYRHYKSKEELAYSLFSTHLERLTRDLQARVDAESGARAKIRALVGACFDAYESERDLFTYLILSEHRAFKRFAGARDHAGLVFLRVIQEGQKAGEVRGDDAAVLTALFLGTVIRACLFRVYGRIPRDLRRHAAATADAVWRAVKR